MTLTTRRSPLLAWLALATATATAGCYSHTDYAEDITAARCQLWSDCDYFEQLNYDDMDECNYYQALINDPDNSDTYPTGCDFDRERAVLCVEGVNQMVCDDLAENDFPFSCDEVCNRGD